MIRLFARHTGRHVPGTEPVPFVCLNCLDGYHHGTAAITWPCECLCVDSENQSIRATVNIRPSWLERFMNRATQFRDWAQRPYVPRPAAGDQVSDGRGQPAARPGHPEPQFLPGSPEAAEYLGTNYWTDWRGQRHSYPHAQDDEACPKCGLWGFDGTLCQRCGYGHGYLPPARVTAVIPPGHRVSGTLTDDTDIIPMLRLTARRQVRTAWIMPPNMPRPVDASGARTGPGQPETPWQRHVRLGVPESLMYVVEALTHPYPRALAAA